MQDCPQLSFIEILLLFLPCVYFLLQSDRWILIDGVDFVGVGAEVFELLGQHLYHLKHIFALFLLCLEISELSLELFLISIAIFLHVVVSLAFTIPDHCPIELFLLLFVLE